MPSPRFRPVTPRRQLAFQLVSDAHKSSYDILSLEPELIATVLLAVIQRLSKRGGELEAAYVKRLLHAIAVVKLMPLDFWNPSHTIHSFRDLSLALPTEQTVIKRLVEAIAKSPAPRYQHDPSIACAQRDLLAKYFRAKGCPMSNVRSITNQKLWIREHETNLLTMLTQLPCRATCEYTMSLDLMLDGMKKRHKPFSEVELHREILACLHKLNSAEAARRLLKPSTRMPRRRRSR